MKFGAAYGEKNALIKKLAVGDIVAVCERGLTHFLNRIAQRTRRWHHVMLYIGSGKVLEAIPMRGCVISNLNLTRKRYHSFKVLRNNLLHVCKKKRIVANAIKLFLGKKFSHLQVIKIFLFRMFIFKNKRNVLPKGQTMAYQCNTDQVVCSNLIAISYYLEGQLISPLYKPEFVVPKDYDHVKEFDVVLEQTYQKGL